MTRYQRLKSILHKNGKNYSVDLQEWAVASLSGDQLQQFLADEKELNEYFRDQMIAGNLTHVSDITEEVITPEGSVSIVVGIEFTLSENYVIPPKEQFWFDLMSKDPAIIKFHTHQIIEE